ncbi:hypothetical protein [Bizionia arctica]|uniref:Uncharacterized protein n=1 Tax=Bizionia arctica TaxID=1495645 RepID=A0A917GHI7_9FLAO|nr:hypothetical protein [Bizionia arctica]GGG46579.1 hypothetical protein GCM10010976_17580 [Bizionia arctica]
MAKKIENSILTDKQVFNNQTFDSSILEKGFTAEEDILFNNCTFKGITSFDNITVREFGFYNCKFENVFSLTNSNIFILGFSSCEFKKKFSITENNCRSYCTLRDINSNEITINGHYQYLQFVQLNVEKLELREVNNKFTHRDSTIEFLAQNRIKNLSIKSNINYSQIIFKAGNYDSIHFEGIFNNHINFEKKIITEYLFFESSTFNSRIDFQEGFFQYIRFSRSNFNGLIYLNGYNYLDNKTRELEIKDLSIHSSVFDKDMSVNLSNIKYLNFSNNNFKQLFHFNSYTDTTKNEDMIMVRISGVNQGNIVLERAYLDIDIRDINFGNIFFKEANISSLVLSEFHNIGSVFFTNILSGLHLIIQDSIVGNLNFINSDINIFEEIVIADSKLNGISLKKYPNTILSSSSNPKVGYGIKDKSKRKENLKNVYTQLKEVARTNGDFDNANKYKSLEHIELLKSKKFSADSILLFLNWISNNNGRSWLRGVLFTIIVSVIFCVLYFFTLNIESHQYPNYKELILFITSFPKLELEKFEIQNKSWEISLVIWLARIFISYGIYQTITAFRKYGRG